MAFENLSIIDGSLQASLEGGGEYKSIRTWFGRVLRTGFPDDYLKWRDRVSDAAYWGRWDQLWEAIETGQREFHEMWPNATRLSKYSILCLASLTGTDTQLS